MRSTSMTHSGNRGDAPYASYVLAAIACLVCAACQDPISENCPDVAGVFLASYQYREGSCGEVPAYALTLDEGAKGMVTRVETRVADVITTDLIFKGCTVALEQSIDLQGRRASRLSGDLQVASDAELSGAVTRVEYMEDGAVRCHGVYDAVYRRQDAVIGGAAERAQRGR